MFSQTAPSRNTRLPEGSGVLTVRILFSCWGCVCPCPLSILLPPYARRVARAEVSQLANERLLASAHNALIQQQRRSLGAVQNSPSNTSCATSFLPPLPPRDSWSRLHTAAVRPRQVFSIHSSSLPPAIQPMVSFQPQLPLDPFQRFIYATITAPQAAPITGSSPPQANPN